MTKRKSAATPSPAPDAAAASYVASIVTPPVNAITRAEGRGDVTISDEGLAWIRRRASDGASQVLIASELGISKTTFQSAMKRDQKVRVAYEHGHAELEQELVSILVATARKGAFVPAMFLLKSKFGYVEGAAPVSTAPAVTIVLPDAYSPEQYVRIINEPRRVTRPVIAPPPSGKGGITR